MSVPRKIVVVGAGIGGLTAALALAKRGHAVAVFEQADRLEPVGAGLQLSPNASRILIGLGLREHLGDAVVAPRALNVMAAGSGRVLARADLRDAETRYGAPYWVVHRGDLHSALLQAVQATPAIELKLGSRVVALERTAAGIVLTFNEAGRAQTATADALIGADGLWSRVRSALGHHQSAPRFAHHSAWRAVIAPEAVPNAMRAPAVNLWLGADAHLVHYPVRGGRLINVVAVVRDEWRDDGWSVPGERAELLARFAPERWHGPPRDLIAAAPTWLKWALHDCAPFRDWGNGAATLLGDAAHPMLPFLAQGAAMAIEDAAILADCLAPDTADVAAALRRYEARRLPRTTRVQRAAGRNATAYHLGPAGAALRRIALAALGGAGLMRNYDWLYRWRPD